MEDADNDGEEGAPSTFFTVAVNMDEAIDPTVKEGLHSSHRTLVLHSRELLISTVNRTLS